MRFDGKTNPQVAKRLTVSELSGVGTPAHEGADVTLFKTGDDVDLVKGLFEEALQSQEIDDKTHDMLRNVMNNHDLLRGVVRQIMGDPEKTAQMRMDEIKEAVNEYVSSVMVKQSGEYAYSPEGGTPKLPIDTARRVSAAVAALGPGFRGQKVELPDDARPGVIRRVRAAYEKFFPDKEVPDVLKTAGSSSCDKGGRDMPGNKPTLDELQKQLQDTQQKLQVQKKINDLSDEHRSYYKTLKGETADQFLNADDTTRDTQMAMAKAAVEEYETADGTIIKSSELGAAFAVIKSQDQEMRKLREEQAMVKASAEVEAEYPHLPGDAMVKAKAVMALDAIPAEQRETLKAMLKAVDAKAAGHFQQKGAAGENDGNGAADKLDAMVKTRAEKDNISEAQAYSKVLDTKEGLELYNAMREG